MICWCIVIDVDMVSWLCFSFSGDDVEFEVVGVVVEGLFVI